MLNYRIGSEVPPFIHNGNQMGCVLFDLDAPDDYDYVAKKILKTLSVKVIWKKVLRFWSENKTAIPSGAAFFITRWSEDLHKKNIEI